MSIYYKYFCKSLDILADMVYNMCIVSWREFFATCGLLAVADHLRSERLEVIND